MELEITVREACQLMRPDGPAAEFGLDVTKITKAATQGV